jgi:8-oxo-dGTP pyrophosphatase MutT (NUDIX family)
MDYIKELRERIGHWPVILVGAAVLIVDSENKLLLFKRTDNGCWGPPGGMMEPGESIEETARREIREETGLSLSRLALFGVFSGPDLFYVYPNGDQVYNVTVAYETREFTGNVLINRSEGRDYRFFSLQSLPEPISPTVKGFISQFMERSNLERSDHDQV